MHDAILTSYFQTISSRSISLP